MRLRPRHLRRYREIVEILADRGFGALLTQLGISERLNLPRRWIRRQPIPEDELTLPIRARTTLEDLGPTFVKVGQILSTRSDLIPPEYLVELRRLQDDVSPLSWDVIKPEIEKELGKPVNQLFLDIDPNPIASASLAQVHAARMPNGTQVIVKVLRPGIEETVKLDLDILYDLAQLAEERTPLGNRYDLMDLAEEFSFALKEELDLRREGRNADRFREQFEKNKYMYVPRVFWEHTTQRVMVQERIHGIKIDDLKALDAAGMDRKKLAQRAADMVLQEVLDDGFFHADPHPGNMLIMEGGVIGMLDFGTMGRIEKSERVALARLFIVAVQMDVDGIVDQLIRMDVADYSVDRKGLARDLRRSIMRYYGLPLNQIPAMEVWEGLEPIIYEYNLRVPSDYWLLIKTIIIMEGVGLGLDPEFDMVAAAQPYLGRLFRQLWMPSTWGSSLLRIGADWTDFVSGFPRQSTHILKQLERGDLEVRIRVPELEQTNRNLNRIVNRLIYGILVAAMTVALALLIPSLDLTWPWSLITWIIFLGFLGMSFLGIRLIWSIWRSNRKK
ncbi:MAG: ABC1 kinase family protein [Anaerolineales bacterium]|jgi:ubiquinone biosynthesis protein